MGESKEKTNRIALDINTQADLKSLAKVINEAQHRIGIIINTYIRAKNKTGDYGISKDFTTLEKIEKKEK